MSPNLTSILSPTRDPLSMHSTMATPHRVDHSNDRAPSLHDVVAQVSVAIASASPDHHDAAIDEALARTGTFVGADRSYLMVIDWERGVSRNTHEWCAGGIEPQIDQLQAVPIEVVPWFMERLRQGVVDVLDVSRLPPEAAMERELCEAQSIQSILIIPVAGSTGLMGFVGFDAVRSLRMWSSEESKLLGVLATLMGSALERQAAYERLSASRRQLAAMIEAIPDLVFSIASDDRLSYVKASQTADLLRPADELKGRSIHEFLQPELSARLSMVLADARGTNTVQRLQYEIPFAEGPRHFEARCAAHDEGVTLIVRNVTEQILAQRVIEEHRERLRILAEQQAAAEQALRLRVAAEVHDGLAQELAMARILIAKMMANREPEPQTMQLVSQVLEGAVARVNELTTEICPPALRVLGVPPALCQAGERLADRHDVDFELELVGDLPRQPQGREAVLYWSTHELMVNVIKHACASRMRVKIALDGEMIRIEVEDDGRGVDTMDLTASTGFGLFNVRERLRLEGGELRVVQLSPGTRATIELPLAGGAA